MRQIARLSLRDLLYVVYRDRSRILGIVLAALVAAAAYVFVIADTIYIAESRVLVRIGKEKLAGVEALAKDNYNILFQERGQDIHNGIEILRDPQFSVAVLQQLRGHLKPAVAPEGWFARAKFEIKAVWRAVREALVEPLYWVGLRTRLSEEEALVRALRASMGVEAIEDTDVIKIGFGWTDPQFAALAVNAYTKTFVSKYSEVYANPKSEQFYLTQLSEQEQRLKDAEAALAAFQVRHDITHLALQKEILLRDIAQDSARLADVRGLLQEQRAAAQRVNLRHGEAQEWIQTPEIRQRIVIDLGPLDRQYYELVAKRAQLATTYTAASPEMTQLVQRVDKLRAEKADRLSAWLVQAMAGTETEAGLLEAQWREKRQRLAELNEITATHAELLRTRQGVETDLLNYRKKAEELRVSDLLSESLISGVRVVSEARAPAEPAAPRKGLILALAAGLGLFLALAYSAIAEYFNQTFRGAEDVRALLGVPLLMTLPLVKSAGERP